MEIRAQKLVGFVDTGWKRNQGTPMTSNVARPGEGRENVDTRCKKIRSGDDQGGRARSGINPNRQKDPPQVAETALRTITAQKERIKTIKGIFGLFGFLGVHQKQFQFLKISTNY